MQYCSVKNQMCANRFHPHLSAPTQSFLKSILRCVDDLPQSTNRCEQLLHPNSIGQVVGVFLRLCQMHRVEYVHEQHEAVVMRKERKEALLGHVVEHL